MPKITKSKPEGYLAFGDAESKNASLSSYSSVIDNFDGHIHKAYAAPTEIVKDISVRMPFTSTDYEFFRPNEAMPHTFRQMILACRATYIHIGIIRNVIDLMTDFSCEDLDLIHEDPKVEAFFKVWAKKVKLFDTAQEFARHFMVDGNVVIKRITAKLNAPVEKQWNASAKPDFKEIVKTDELQPREIPFRYIFINIVNLKWAGGLAATIADKKFLTFQLSSLILNGFKGTAEEKAEILASLPMDIRKHLETNPTGEIPLDMSKIHISYNKKDSWESWANPYLLSVLKDVKFRDKLRQAEISALDGMINAIRVWKLGDHKEGLLPNQAVVDKLNNILSANSGGGTLDLVWDSMIEMTPYYPPVKDILGSEKYDQVNRDILVGLGVPEVLLGGTGANFSNSWIQLKTLVEKLKTVRTKITDWLDEETGLVCKAMGFASKPHVRYNYNNLQDETIKQKLIIGLLDRGVISAESVLNLFNEDFGMEVERLKSEKKIFETSKLERPNPISNQEAGTDPNKGKAPNGRPPMKQDTMKRNNKAPKVKSSMITKGLQLLDFIDNIIIEKNIDPSQINNIRTLVLSSFGPDENITIENVQKTLKTPNINQSIVIAMDEQPIDMSDNDKKMAFALIWATYA